ncbi:uncharacterized protein Z518_01607 [Rhinocladiella mackenziei CBS 650.93]|uniref:xyloglucan-specific endo-beta-1,4-glucanase n=1 Tax=Rhinocladiella mackenziei CBS 650.93 TaxID=1442369 RepID=A0A0D2IX15_9EURO|nr:uncharacterized protein Z518_01607 [Rhinocladiella mackenziei CBS 650.93]KIX10524.1 hypothetical protein Z518_01607 [Rhinocladiella mackenziei CBS 650.93]
MGLKSLISFGFLILPIAVTISVLLGLQAYRDAHGLSRPFVSNSIKSTTYCQRAFGITPDTDGQKYTLNPNQWGVTDDYTGGGGLCMNVTTFDNASYPTNTTAPKWSITWQFPPGPPTQPVHAFPNIKMDASDVFPIEISDVATINFQADWAYGVGDEQPTTTNVADLNAIDLNSNVAIDMFLDSDPDKATSTVDAKYEVMIWLGYFGPATQPIGLDVGAVATQDVNGTTFSLYFGENGLGQSVLTWVANGSVQNFVADIGPLLQGLTGIGGPTVNDYLGYLAFGSEALSSGSNVTFYNPNLSMAVVPK